MGVPSRPVGAPEQEEPSPADRLEIPARSLDAQLYRMFQVERDRLEGEGATITRVVLDYELKADYHAWVHEQTKQGTAAADARKAFAEDHDLRFRPGHIQLPDLRLEYETADGLREHRDLELATEHYSRSQLSGKQAAGFRVYRAAGTEADKVDLFYNRLGLLPSALPQRTYRSRLHSTGDTETTRY